MNYPPPQGWGAPPPAKPPTDRRALVALACALVIALICGVCSVVGKRRQDRGAAEAQRLAQATAQAWIAQQQAQQAAAPPPALPTSAFPTPADTMCARFSRGNANSTPSSRASLAETYTAGVPFLERRRVRVEAAGDGNTVLRFLGMPDCDDTTMRRALDSRNTPNNFRTMCTAFGFERVECVGPDGGFRLIRFDTACQCVDRWTCQCQF